MKPFFLTALASLVLVQLDRFAPLVQAQPNQKFSVTKSDSEWKKQLSPIAYTILRHEGTEKPYSGKYWNLHDAGTFSCAGCDQLLFSSAAKFDSGTGWPSFSKEISKGKTLIRIDNSLGSERHEVICARCGGHLGHVFDDGPEPTGLRYCMNSPALRFKKK